MIFQRYRPFIRDWAAFSRAIERPEPRTFRIRSGRVASGELVARLEAQGFRVVPSLHLDGVYRVAQEPFPLSETLEHWLGLFYIQQEATALPALLLDPRPGEGILDLCAAPGGKTAHLAELMRDRGLVVAVDPSEPRLRALAGNVSRLALSSVVGVRGRGEAIPTSADFHRVLVDAPCSGEGRARRGGAREASPGDLKRLPRLQEALLRRAIAVTVSGGRILYVTCTLAPEENEGVVDRVLRDAPVRIVPLTPDLPHAPGLTGFQGTRFLPDVAGCCRIHPHHLDSGGLFLALLEREGGGGGGGREASEAAPPPPDARDLPGWTPVSHLAPPELSSADPVPPALEARGWIRRGNTIRMLGLPAWPLDTWRKADSTLVALHAGLRAVVRERGRGREARGGSVPEPAAPGRPAMDLLRWLGPRGAGPLLPGLELSPGEWMALLEGRELRKAGLPDGPVGLTLEGELLGRGRLRGGRVLGELSQPRARWLHQVLQRRDREETDSPGAV